MSHHTRLALASIFLWLVAISMMAQAPPSADSYVSKLAPSANYGLAPILAVQEGTTSYIRFDLSPLPEGMHVSKATLRLYVNNVLAPGSFDVYLVNDKWDERTLNYDNAPILGESATGGHPVSVSPSRANQFLLVDITDLVWGWLTGTIPNNGIALALAEDPSGKGASFSFDSKENNFTGHQPELTVLSAVSACDSRNPASLCTGPVPRYCCECNDNIHCDDFPVPPTAIEALQLLRDCRTMCNRNNCGGLVGNFPQGGKQCISRNPCPGGEFSASR